MVVVGIGRFESRGAVLALVALASLCSIASSAMANSLAPSQDASQGENLNLELPEIYTSLPAMSVAAESKRPLLRLPAARSSLARSTTRWSRRDRYTNRYRRKVVKITRTLEVGRDEVIVRFVSPGKRKSLASLELKF